MSRDLSVEGENSSFAPSTSDHILSSLDVVMWAIAVSSHRLVHISPGIEHLTGHRAQRLLDEQWCWDSLIHPEDVELTQQLFRSLSPGDRRSFECRMMCADSQVRSMTGHATLICDAAAHPVRIQGIMLAIAPEPTTTLQHKHPPVSHLSYNLRSNLPLNPDRTFRALAEQTSVGVVQLDHEGRYRFVNLGFCSMVGYTTDELLNMTVADLTHPDDIALGAALHHREHQAQERHTAEGLTREMRYVCKDGQVRWVKIVVAALQGANEATDASQQLPPDAQQSHHDIALIWDIGDRKQAEQSLRQSQQMLQLVIDNIPQRIFWKDTNLVYLGCNQLQAECAGLSSPQGIFGKTDYDLPWNINDAERYRRRDRYVIETNQADYYVSEVVRQTDGQAILTETNKIPLCDSDGRVIGVLGTVDNLTERKRAETALVEKTAELQAVFAAFPDSFFRIAADGTYLDCKVQNSRDFLLLSVDQLLGRRIQDVLPDPIGQDMWKGIQETIQTQGLIVLDHALEMAQGTQYFEARIVPYQDNEVLVLVRNQTRRKQAEQALIRSDKRFQRLAENLPGAIYQYQQLTDLEQGQFLYLSPSLRRLYGLEPQQVLAESRRMRDMMHPNDWPLVEASLRQATTSLSPWRAEWRIQTAIPGEQKWIQTIARPERQPDGSVLWDGILLDITEHKRFEVMLRHQAYREQALNQVIRAIRDSLDLGTIFSTAASQTATLLDAQRVFIIRYAPEKKSWQFVMDYQPQEQGTNLLGSAMKDGDRHLFTRLKQGNSLRLTAQQLCRIMSDGCRQIVVEAPGHWLIVPLMVSGEATAEKPIRSRVVSFQDTPYVWGCLCLVSSHPQTRWQDYDHDLAQVIANQLAIAIQQSELYHRIRLFNVELEHQVQHRTVELEYALSVEALLKRIIDDVRDSLDEDRILQTVVRELATTLVLDCCNTALYDLDAEVAYIRQEYLTIDIAQLQGYREPLGSRPEAYPQLLAGQTAYFSYVESEYLRPGYKPTVLCYPIVSEGQVLGDLWLYRPQYAAFSTLEIRLVEKIVSQCAIAMRQARLYRAAQAQVQELERLNQLKDDFLCTVSHELRTPIAAIHMATQMLEIHLAPKQSHDESLAEPIAQCLTILRDGAEQEMTLINNLLDLQHLRAGTHPLEVSQIEVQTWLPYLIDALDFQMHSHDQTLRLELPDTLPPIYSDQGGLQRIFVELLNNAYKYSPPGANITLMASATEHQIQFEICNTGVEIPISELPYVFDQFYRVPQVDRWQHGGIGLGLALVNEWVHYLQGEIFVESDRNETRFILYFPIECRAVDL